MQRAATIWFIGLTLAFGAFLHALATGSVAIPAGEVVRVVAGGGASAESAQVVLELRLPRALAAFAVGGLLALAGALMQTLMRNALADPYLLGLSGGAAAGALGAMILGASMLALHLSAAGGALLTSALVLWLARRDFSAEIEPGAAQRLLLSGVAIAALAGAVVVLILSVAPEAQVRGMLFWLIGDLAGAADWRPAWIAVCAALALVMPHARGLNVLSRGDLTAESLGVDARRLRLLAFLIASIITAVAVATAGTIGFVGLIAPHLVRLAVGADHRVLLPAAALAGGSLLLIADTLARSLAAPTQLPTGALTALIGVPVFLAILWRQGRGR
ncbi:MAG: FecCD family ABC transporter permease [Burkholderiales bacterium]